MCPTASCEKEVLYPGVPWIRSLENFTGEWLLSCDRISCVDICGGSQGNWVLPSDQTTSSLWVVAFLCAWISLAHPVRSRALVPGELDQEKMLGPKVVEMCPVAAATVYRNMVPTGSGSSAFADDNSSSLHLGYPRARLPSSMLR